MNPSSNSLPRLTISFCASAFDLLEAMGAASDRRLLKAFDDCLLEASRRSLRLSCGAVVTSGPILDLIEAAFDFRLAMATSPLSERVDERALSCSFDLSKSKYSESSRPSPLSEKLTRPYEPVRRVLAPAGAVVTMVVGKYVIRLCFFASS